MRKFKFIIPFNKYSIILLVLHCSPATQHKSLAMFRPDKNIGVLTNSASQVLPFWFLSDTDSIIHVKCHFWQCVSVFLTFCSISARRRAWLRHHLSPLFSFIFHALCMSFLFLSQTKKLQNTTAFLLFIIFMNSTNVLIFSIPLSFLVTYFLLLTCRSAYDFNVVKKQRQ